MRAALVLALALAPAVAGAQGRVPAPRVTGSLPPIGLPLPSITPRLAPIGLPRSVDAMQPALREPHVPNGHHPGSARRHSAPVAVYFVPAFVWGGLDARYQRTREPKAASRDRARGRNPVGKDVGVLRLDVEPFAALQVFVDGYFVGTPADFGGGLEIEEGPHRIELRAQGYRTIAFDAQIAAGRTISYRAALERLEPASPSPAEAPAASAPPLPAKTTVYLIPGCYLVNVPPDPARLRPACDASKLTTFEP